MSENRTPPCNDFELLANASDLIVNDTWAAYYGRDVRFLLGQIQKAKDALEEVAKWDHHDVCDIYRFAGDCNCIMKPVLEALNSITPPL